MRETFWSLAMAIAWIAWRDPDMVLEIFTEGRAGTYAFLGALTSVNAESGNSPEMSVGEAKEQLWAALKDGKVSAEGIDVATGHRTAIRAIEFYDLVLYPELDSDKLRNPNIQGGIFKDVYTDVAVQRDAIVGIWGGLKPTIAAERKCLRWLSENMRTSLESSDKSKMDWYRNACELFPRIGKKQAETPSRPFNRAWDGAIKVTGAKWGEPGRKQKSQR
jgi:hypothetical protein